MQQCNFDFEIIINDDCSTDGTTEIIREYQSKYPDIIKPIYHEENEYSKGVRGMFAKFVFPKAHGKYLAFCEGDDYWTDPLKLQKQVDFMEANPDYSMCYHNVYEMWEKEEYKNAPFSNTESRNYSGIEIYSRRIVPTNSILMRRTIIESKIYNKALNYNLCFGDVIIFLTAAELGQVYGMSEIMGVYRRHPGGMVYSLDNKAKIRLMHFDNHIPIIFGKTYLQESKRRVFETLWIGCKDNFRSKNYIWGIIFFLYSIIYSPKKTTLHIFQIFKKILKK